MVLTCCLDYLSDLEPRVSLNLNDVEEAAWPLESLGLEGYFGHRHGKLFFSPSFVGSSVVVHIQVVVLMGTEVEKEVEHLGAIHHYGLRLVWLQQD